MKNKMIIIFLLLLVIVTGCSKENINDKNNQKEDIIVTIGEEKFKLSSERNLENMYFKENYVDFTTDTVGNMHIIQYRKQDKFIFETRILCDKDHTFEENKNKINHEETLKTVNGIEYTYYDYLDDQNNIVHLYMYYYNNITYAILFASSTDISNYETTFMNNVYFK